MFETTTNDVTVQDGTTRSQSIETTTGTLSPDGNTKGHHTTTNRNSVTPGESTTNSRTMVASKDATSDSSTSHYETKALSTNSNESTISTQYISSTVKPTYFNYYTSQLQTSAAQDTTTDRSNDRNNVTELTSAGHLYTTVTTNPDATTGGTLSTDSQNTYTPKDVVSSSATNSKTTEVSFASKDSRTASTTHDMSTQSTSGNTITYGSTQSSTLGSESKTSSIPASTLEPTTTDKVQRSSTDTGFTMDFTSDLLDSTSSKDQTLASTVKSMVSLIFISNKSNSLAFC